MGNKYAYLLEVRPNGVDLMYEILDGEDIVLAERLLDDRVAAQGNACLIDFAVTALVDQLADSLEVRFTIIKSQAAVRAVARSTYP